MPRAKKKHPGGRPPKGAKLAGRGKKPISPLPYRLDYDELAASKRHLSKREGKALSFLDVMLRSVRESKAFQTWKRAKA
jgi:hypothetical protein